MSALAATARTMAFSRPAHLATASVQSFTSPSTRPTTGADNPLAFALATISAQRFFPIFLSTSKPWRLQNDQILFAARVASFRASR